MSKYIYDPNELVDPDCPNFTMGEVFKSSTALRFGIDNSEGYTSRHRILDQTLVRTILQPMRNLYGSFSPSSWYRCETLEKVICKESFLSWCDENLAVEIPAASFPSYWPEYFLRKSHPKGGTVDFEINTITNDNLFNAIKKTTTVYDQLIREFAKPNDPKSGWIHISVAAKGENRNQTFSRS